MKCYASDYCQKDKSSCIADKPYKKRTQLIVSLLSEEEV